MQNGYGTPCSTEESLRRSEQSRQRLRWSSSGCPRHQELRRRRKIVKMKQRFGLWGKKDPSKHLCSTCWNDTGQNSIHIFYQKQFTDETIQKKEKEKTVEIVIIKKLLLFYFGWLFVTQYPVWTPSTQSFEELVPVNSVLATMSAT